MCRTFINTHKLNKYRTFVYNYNFESDFNLSNLILSKALVYPRILVVDDRKKKGVTLKEKT